MNKILVKQIWVDKSESSFFSRSSHFNSGECGDEPLTTLVGGGRACVIPVGGRLEISSVTDPAPTLKEVPVSLTRDELHLILKMLDNTDHVWSIAPGTMVGYKVEQALEKFK